MKTNHQSVCEQKMPKNSLSDALYENWKPFSRKLWWLSLAFFGFLLPMFFGWFHAKPGFGSDVFLYDMVNILAACAYVYAVLYFHSQLLPTRDLVERCMPKVSLEKCMHREYTLLLGRLLLAQLFGIVTLVEVVNLF
jgi:hypothetical protein